MHLSSMYIALSNYKISKCYLFLLCVGQMTTDSICAVMHKADIQLQNWEKIAKSLNLDCNSLTCSFLQPSGVLLQINVILHGKHSLEHWSPIKTTSTNRQQKKHSSRR